MRKVVYAINQTVDGCFDHTKMNGSEEMHVFWTNILRTAGLLVYGRVTYQLMVPFWPEVAKHQSMSKVSNEFATTFDSINKVVFSTTLEKVEDRRSRLVRGDPGNEIRQLKQQQGKDILVGGVMLPSQLIALGLVDECLFVVHPVIGGSGKRLMEGVDPAGKLPMKLIESTAYKSGFVALRYETAPDKAPC